MLKLQKYFAEPITRLKKNKIKRLSVDGLFYEIESGEI